MSASSVVSSHSSAWRLKLNPPLRIQSIMDSIFAIAFGLGLRFVVGLVTRHDAKVTGTLVGLWEGIILLHFLKKMPKSTDPYVAYAVRLVIDLVWTAEGDDALARLVLVLIWTALGMVLADIAPPLWVDSGLERVWRRLRRDLYTMTRMVPTVAFFPPARTVRFSPARPLSDVLEEPSVLDEGVFSPPPSDVTPLTTTDAFPISSATPSQPATVARRRLPGHFPSDTSEADSDISSMRAGRHDRTSTTTGRTARRLSVYPEYADSVSDDLDLDDANLSSQASDSQSDASTERGADIPQDIDPQSIPDMLADEEPAAPSNAPLTVDTNIITTTITTTTAAAAAAIKPEDPTTPRAGPTYLPPTPSDSAWRQPHLRGEPSSAIDPLPVRPNLGLDSTGPSARPQSAFLPQIPDFLEEAATEDWEAIQPAEYASKPPTPPAKDGVGAVPARYSIPRPAPGAVPPVTAIPLVVPPLPSIPPPVPVASSTHNRAASKQDEEWDALKAQFVVPATASNQQHPEEAPRTYKDSSEFDDIYGEEYVPVPSAVPTAAPADGSVPVGDLLMSDSPPPDNVPRDVAAAGQGAAASTTLAPLNAPFSFNFGQQGSNFGGFRSTNPWNIRTAADDPFEEFKRQQLEDEERVRVERDMWLRNQEEQRKAKEEAEEQRRRDEVEEAAKVAEEKRREEEEEAAKLVEEKRRKEEEKAERKRKEEEDELARRKRFEEEEARRQEEEEAQRKKDQEEAAAQLKREKEEKKARKEEAKRLKEEEARRLQEEAEEREREEKRKKEEAKEKKRKDAQEAAERRAKEEEKERAEREKAEKEAQEKAAAEAEVEAKRQAETEAAAAAAEAKRQAEADAAAAAAQAAREQEERERDAEAEAEAARIAQDAVATALALEGPSPSAEAQADAEAPADAPVDGPPDVAAENNAEANGTPEEEQLGTGQLTPKDNLRKLDELLRTPVIDANSRMLEYHDPLRTPAGGAEVPLSGPPADAEDNGPAAAGETHDTTEPVFDAQDAPGSPAPSESIMSEASVMPDKVGERLDRLLLGKAQMVDTQEIIDRVKRDLLADGADEAALKDELKRTEKIMRKMRRKEERRYEEGIVTHSTYDASEPADQLDYGNAAPGPAGTMTLEKLELLLKPGVKSLNLALKMAPGKKGPGIKQKQKVAQVLDDLGLLNYATDTTSTRGYLVDVPEAHFDKWLQNYRISSAPKDDDDGWH